MFFWKMIISLENIGVHKQCRTVRGFDCGWNEAFNYKLLHRNSMNHK